MVLAHGCEPLEQALEERRLEEQESRFQTLRTAMDQAEQRSQAGAELVQNDLGELKDALPALVSTVVTDQIADLEMRFNGRICCQRC